MNFLKSDGHEPYVDVPVPKPVLQYFTQKYGGREIHIDGYHEFSPIMKLAIDKVPYRRMTIRKRKTQSALTLILPVRYRFGNIQEATLNIISEWLERMMNRDLLLFVSGAYQTGCSEQAAVQTFIDIHGLELDVDTLRMRYRRSDEFKFYEKNNVANVVRQNDVAVQY